MKTTLFNYPEYAEIDGEKYHINTDFRVAIKCNELTMDKELDDMERGLAIIYLLFGEKGLKAVQHYDKLAEKAVYFLRCGIDDTFEENNEKPDMDFVEDMPYIEASFQSDFGINLENTKMHWWKFYNLMNGLSNSEMGNCCVLNRIRNLRNLDLREIKDAKTRKDLQEAKKRVALKKYQPKKKEATEEQLKSANEFIKALGL